jgi:hypothetical protein
MKKVTAKATSSPPERRHEFRKKRRKSNSIVADWTWEISPINPGLSSSATIAAKSLRRLCEYQNFESGNAWKPNPQMKN